MASPGRPTPAVTIVLPTYDERDNVAPLIRRLLAVVPWPVEVLVVDDDSPDGTSEVVLALARETGRVRLILRQGERGLTAAIQRGIDEAAGEVVVWMDCDLSMPPEIVPDLVSCVIEGRADAAIGSRYVDGGMAETGGDDPALVRLQKRLTRVMNRGIAWLTGSGLRDWTSGFIAIRSSLIREIRLDGDYGEYFIALAAELLCRRATIVEIPYRCVPRRAGKSKTARGPHRFFLLGVRYLRALLAAGRSIRQTRAGMISG